MPGCSSGLKFKFNIIRHMKRCVQQLKQKEGKCDNTKYQVCEKIFAQKSNRHRHVNSQHSGEESDDTTTIPTFISDLESQPEQSNQPSDTASNTDQLTPLSISSEVLNVSFVSDDGNTIDLEGIEK